MANPDSPTIHKVLAGWMRALPCPAMIVSRDKHLVFTNDSFEELCAELGLSTESFDPVYLLSKTLFDHRHLDGIGDMEPGQFLRSPILLGSPRKRFTMHAVRLGMEDAFYFCCVLIPESETEPTDLIDILDKLSCYIAQFDGRGNIIYINQPLIHHLGYAPEDASLLRNIKEIDAELTDEILREYRNQTKGHGHVTRNSKFRKKDGSLISVEVSVLASELEENDSYLLTARDITIELEARSLQEKALEAAIGRASRLKIDNANLHAELDEKTIDRPLVYKSKAYQQVVDKIKKVARTDATVLVTGETGTGKEVIARMIHRLSDRENGPLVIVDCSSIPAQLIESELFGYRKGAFTGANKDHKGRFASADGGTIFLDEIGEMPLELQSRLLRVLQDGRFTPIGQNEAISTNFRVIAATNRDLNQQAREGKFRSDLLYRLNVFPIHSTPLRERIEDIEVLTDHFVKQFNGKFGKRVLGVDAYTLERLRNYSFPGNIRELENMIERAFVVSNGQILPIDLPNEATIEAPQPILDVFDGRLTEFLSLEDYQRKYIELVLASTDGKVSGPDGAAEVLKLNPQTLFSKMKKLRIKR